MPPKGRVQRVKLPDSVRRIYPFKDRWIDIDGHRIHYLDEGRQNGPPVILLHGNPTWSFLYREIIPLIESDCRAIAPDYVGMGLSDKPLDERWYTLENHTRVITRFIEELNLRDIVLVVQDWGGPIGIGYSLEHLDNVAGMVIMNTWAWPEPSEFHMSIFPWRLLHAPIVGSHFLLKLNVLIERGLYLSTGNREKMKDVAVMEGYRFPFPTPESRIAILAFPRNIPLQPGDLNWDRMSQMEAGLRKLPFPCRLLWGARDIVFPPANALKFHDLIPTCSSPRMIPHGRHFIQEDAPQEIADEVLILIKQART